MLSSDDRSLLLKIARESIRGVFERHPDAWRSITVPDELRRPSGAFVTITERGELRGCIGSVFAVGPLHETVAENAVNAAFRDPRFPPMRPEELDEVHLEISVLSPIEEVENVEEIEVGRDGLIVRSGRSAGLLLPQVAAEYGWDRQTFLRQTCVKAGLRPDAWTRDGVRIERFSAEVFGEDTES